MKKRLNNFNLNLIPTCPGVYSMIDYLGCVIYIGKAKNLKQRLRSYFSNNKNHTQKIKSLMDKVYDIKITTTKSELEALLLEQNYIKEHQPTYNVLLRDDKSYAYIYCADYKEFPSLEYIRGKRNKKGKYFGPYPNQIAVRKTLALLQKIFKVRQCKDSYFNYRKRPCLQYQIGQCKAPCVGYVDTDEYLQDVENTLSFLKGNNKKVLQYLVKLMEELVRKENFEQAAEVRDQIIAIQSINQNQSISFDADDMYDIIGYAPYGEKCAFNVLMVRHGNVVGNQQFMIDSSLNNTMIDNLELFITNFYISCSEQRFYPNNIIVPIQPQSNDLLVESISKIAGHQVHFNIAGNQKYKYLLSLAQQNINDYLLSYESNSNYDKDELILKKLFAQLSLDFISKDMYIECWDISHNQGDCTKAACVVFNEKGSVRNLYRHYTIHNATPGDDGGALKEGISKHYLTKKYQTHLLIVDGGNIQVNAAKQALTDHQQVPILSVKKGIQRKLDEDTFVYNGNIHYFPDEVKLYIQRIRDTAHNFAITKHRYRMRKKYSSSVLDNIKGIGSKRRTKLLQFFGSLKRLEEATIEELCKVDDINYKLACKIFYYLRGN